MVQLLSNSLVETNAPRRVLKYVLVYSHRHTTSLRVDEQVIKLRPGQAVTITSGQIHQFLKLSSTTKILEFTLDFFCKNDDDFELVFHNGLFCHFGMNEVIDVRQPDYFISLINSIERDLLHTPYQYLIWIRSQIELLLVELNRSKIALGGEIWKPDALFLKFLELVRDNYGKNYPIGKYASLLKTTESKLNEQSRLHTGKTAQNVVYSLVVSEAKRLLIYEKDVLVKEIGFRLGFKDPFYFSNFFRKHTGLSPKDYRASLPG